MYNIEQVEHIQQVCATIVHQKDSMDEGIRKHSKWE